MSKALILTENDKLNALYELNLRAYVDLNCFLVSSVEAANDLLQQTTDFDLILLGSFESDPTDMVESIANFLSNVDRSIPMVILGSVTKHFPFSVIVNDPYNVKMVIANCARILEITAKQMSNKEVGPYFSIPSSFVQEFERSPYAIYIRKNGDNFNYDYEIILGENELSTELDIRLKKEKLSKVFIESLHRLKFINLCSKILIDEMTKKSLNDELTTEESMTFIQSSNDFIAESVILNNKITKEVANISRRCMKEVSNILNNNPPAKNLINLLTQNKMDYLYLHSMLATYFSEKIIEQMSWGNEEQAKKVGFAFFFHDLYLAPIYKTYPNAVNEEELLYDDNTKEEDKKIIIEHAKMAGELVKTFPSAPMGVDMLITQHHGMTGGCGFAVQYKDDISPLAKVMIIAEEFAVKMFELYKKGELDEFNYSTICGELNQKYTNHSYKKIINTLQEIPDGEDEEEAS